jgi:hypothetical protein
MDRRDFLRGVALGAVTAGSSIVLSPGAASAQEESEAPQAGGYYAGTVYAEGTVLHRTARAVTIVDPETGMTEVALSPKTSVWKGVHTTAEMVSVGDHLSLRGYRLETGVIDAVAVWANIAWQRGAVKAVKGKVISLEASDGSAGLFHTAGHTALYQSDAPAVRYRGQLQVGHSVEALGAHDRPGGVLVASRVWIA